MTDVRRVLLVGALYHYSKNDQEPFVPETEIFRIVLS
jgi:hypothetical protein